MEKDLSLRELGTKLGDLSAAFLSDIELGRRYPSDRVLSDMARVLGVSIEELRKHDTRPPVELIKKNPQYGFAFRTVIERKVSPAKILDMVNKDKKEQKQ